ncbi:MAG TPA: SDR family NAD-dependent epimerase/dehydratase, partial [Thermoanaerobaculia bacterium]
LREPCNIGNPHEMTIVKFAETIKAVVGSSSPIVFKPLPKDDPHRRRPDIGRAQRELGWEPRISLEEGLGKTVEYFRALLAEQGALRR